MGGEVLGGIFAIFAFGIWLAIMIIIFTMIYRFVKAMERMAESSVCNNLILKDIAQTLKHEDNE